MIRERVPLSEKISLKSEQNTLNRLRTSLHLLSPQIDTPYPVSLFSMLPCMFFRPEEDRLLSKCIDDALILQGQAIYVGNEDEGCARAAADLEIQLAVDRQPDRLPAVGAFGADRHGQRLVS